MEQLKERLQLLNSLKAPKDNWESNLITDADLQYFE